MNYLNGGKEKGCREKRKASINFSNYHPAMVVIVNRVTGSITKSGTVLKASFTQMTYSSLGTAL